MLSYKLRKGTVPVTQTTLYKVFEEAKKNGANTEFFFMESDERVFLKDVWSRADEYAKGMIALGLKRGDTMTSFGLVSAETLYISVGAISIGVGYSHPYAYDPMETSIPGFIELVETSIMILGEGMEGKVMDTVHKMQDEDPNRYPGIKQIYYDETFKGRSETHSTIKKLSSLAELGKNITDEQLRQARDAVEPSDPVMHLFSSGTTGKPKCIVHTHYNLANDVLCQVPRDLESIMVTSNNMDELCGYAGVVIGLAGYSKKVVLGPGSSEEEWLRKMAHAINSENIRHLIVTAGFTSFFMKLAKEEKLEFPSVQTVMLTGQMFSPKFRQDIVKYFNAHLWNMYGLSETLPLSGSVYGTDKTRQQQLDGKTFPLYETEVKLVNESGDIVPVGEPGHILAKTYCTFSQYKNLDPKVYEGLFTEDGFIKSGDMGVMDEDGAIFIKGRTAEAVRFKVFSEVVYPGPIEDALVEMPAIAEAQVVAVSGADFIGDEIVYCLCVAKGHEKPTEEEIGDHITKKLDEMKRPCRIVYLDSFPRTANSRKVSKSKIRALVKEFLIKDPDYGMTESYKALKAALQDGNSTVYE